MKKIYLLIFLLLPIEIFAQQALLTRPEQTDFEETSRYTDVMAFVEEVVASDENMHLTTFGYTQEGRAMPLIVWGDLSDASPETILASGKTRLFVMANIHAGEVCGKEAMQMMLRDLASGQHPEWKTSLVLLIAPIYNADGNERIQLTNRPMQHGPLAGMGQRPNAQEYDLNRDHIKLDSPEANALVKLFNAYDPHVIVDLHTTDGTAHAYHLTYAPPLHPNTPVSIDTFLRETWLPSVTETIKNKYGWHYYHYGNLPWNNRDERGWYTFDHRPRFSNNYAGLRNRFGILSEAYAYATFEERVLATYYFVEEIANFTHNHSARIQQIIATADATTLTNTTLGVQATMKRSEKPVTILMGEVEEQRNPYSQATILLRKPVINPEEMYEYIGFESTETERVPAVYYVPANLEKAINKLDIHGIQYEVLTEEMLVPVEQFKIDSTTTMSRPFQKHQERTLYGAYETTNALIPAGTLKVSMNQPLARLAFTLLEPRSDDGFLNWNVLDEALKEATIYPILRAFKE